MSKFKVGDRVRIIDAGSWGFSVGTIGEIIGDADSNMPEVSALNTSYYVSDWAMEKLSNKGGAQMARKTYKLIKDTPEVRKGALFQEACDDGDQEYVLLDKSFIRVDDWDRYFNRNALSRKTVEEQTKWFAEVFQVEPQYMTATELEQWEAFKAKPAKAVAKKPAAKPTQFATAAQSVWTPERRAAQSKKIKAAWAAKKAA